MFFRVSETNRATVIGRFVILSATIVVPFVFAFGSCVTLNPPIHYILPDGYVGVFRIVLDEREGVEVGLKDGRYTYEIPSSGILKVKSFAPFGPWHEETAAYKNGNPIVLPDSKVRNDVVALRSLGTYQRGDGPRTMAFVIGTKEEEDRLRVEMYKTDVEKITPRSYPQQSPP